MTATSLSRKIPAACFAALVICACSAHATVLSFSGTFTFDDDVVLEPFTLAASSQVSARTFSFGGGTNGVPAVIAAGGFAPVLTLFSASGSQDELQSAAGSANNCFTPGHGNVDPASGFCWDAFFDTVLTAGDYVLAISQDDNLANGPGLADGFSQTGNPNYTGVNFLGDASASFILIGGTQRDGHWAADLEFTATGNAAPEPATNALLALGLGTLLGLHRRASRRPIGPTRAGGHVIEVRLA